MHAVPGRHNETTAAETSRPVGGLDGNFHHDVLEHLAHDDALNGTWGIIDYLLVRYLTTKLRS